MQSLHSDALSAGDVAMKGQLSAISDLQSQIDELKQDKRDLRFDKETMKAEMTRLKQELAVALAHASHTARALQEARREVEDWKKQCLLWKEKAVGGSRLQQSVPAQVNGDPNFDPTAITGKQDDIESIPSGLKLTGTSSRTAADEFSSNQLPRTVLALQLSKGMSITSSAPLTGMDSSSLTSASQTRKRKAVTNVESREGQSSQKRIATTEYPAQRPPHNDSQTAESNGSQVVPSPGRPVVPFNEDEAFVLPPLVLLSYLNHAPPITISPGPSDLHVSRKFLAGTYGGSARGEAQHIPAPGNPSGDVHRAFIFPDFELNPGMPLVPGQSGVIIAPRIDRKTGCTWGLFRKDISGTSDTWVYLGEYEWTAGGQMSPEVFRGQKDRVKKKWANRLLNWKRDISDYYVSMRARIALRKARKLPAASQHAERIRVKQEIDKIRSQTGHPVTQKDIISAFERGDEMVDIDLLRCVSYDRALAQDIEAKFRQPQPKVKRSFKAHSYPSRFLSSAGLTHGLGVRGKRPIGQVFPGVVNASSSSMSTASPSTASGMPTSVSFAEGSVVAASRPGQGTEDLVGSILFGEEEMDEDVECVSDDDMEELCYPD